MRASLYAQILRTDADQDPENQLRRLRAYAEAHQFEIYAEFHDYSAGSASFKPALEKMLKEGRAGHYDALLVVRLDRLGRSTKQLLTVLEDLDRSGIALICTDQNVDTTGPGGKSLLTALRTVAKSQTDWLGERTRDGLTRAKAQGKRLGRPSKPERTEEILQLRAQGLSLRQIGEKVGMSHQSVKQRLRRARMQKPVGNPNESS